MIETNSCYTVIRRLDAVLAVVLVGAGGLGLFLQGDIARSLLHFFRDIISFFELDAVALQAKLRSLIAFACVFPVFDGFLLLRHRRKANGCRWLSGLRRRHPRILAIGLGLGISTILLAGMELVCWRVNQSRASFGTDVVDMERSTSFTMPASATGSDPRSKRP